MLPLWIGVYLGSGGGVFCTTDLSHHATTHLGTFRRLRRPDGEPCYRWFAVAQFRKDFEAAFGVDLARTCLEDQEILIARHARNAFCAQGAEVTSSCDRYRTNSRRTME